MLWQRVIENILCVKLEITLKYLQEMRRVRPWNTVSIKESIKFKRLGVVSIKYHKE